MMSARIRAIRPLYQRGLTYVQIGRQLGVSSSTVALAVAQARASHSQWFPQRALGRKLVERMRAIRPLYRRGLTYTQLACELGLRLSTLTARVQAARARYPQWFPRRGHGRKLAKRLPAVRVLFQRGLTYAQLARKLGVCPSTVTKTLRAARARHPQWFPRRKRGQKVTARFIARLRAIRPLYRRRLTYAEIARKLGVSFMTIAKTMAEARKRYPEWCPPRRTLRLHRAGHSTPLDVLSSRGKRP